jgi:hypothetical protein
MENLLTLCIPSNRNLSKSKRALLMAHSFSQLTDCAVVISDNSGCLDKQSFLSRIASPRFHIVRGPSNEGNNWTTALENAKSEYIWFMCDDDFVIPLGEEGLNELETGARYDDIVGFRPTTFSVVKGGENTRVQRFAIDGRSPADRVLQYLKMNGGNNLTLYSIWKRKAFKKLVSTTAHHPVTIQGRTAGYADWSNVVGLVSSGKIPTINALGYVYSNDNWSTTSAIAESNSTIYRRAGIPDSAEAIRGLLLAADSIATICGRHSAADSADKRDAADILVSSELERFSSSLLASLEEQQSPLPITMAAARIMGEGFSSFDERVERLIAVIDLWIPGFGPSYARYFSEVVDPICYRPKGHI